ncbi:hypothetical protein CDAR_66081 [Caerostris darwini]|uniref:Uncharacterized protein n=1 Tax=Caerostris darwini TaxID=1538125 RepID=A0AAV4TZR6_9ARAC|nr:hypothetical protein CDAR_66081 [Caerostris darwini]
MKRFFFSGHACLGNFSHASLVDRILEENDAYRISSNTECRNPSICPIFVWASFGMHTCGHACLGNFSHASLVDRILDENDAYRISRNSECRNPSICPIFVWVSLDMHTCGHACLGKFSHASLVDRILEENDAYRISSNTECRNPSICPYLYGHRLTCILGPRTLKSIACGSL